MTPHRKKAYCGDSLRHCDAQMRTYVSIRLRSCASRSLSLIHTMLFIVVVFCLGLGHVSKAQAQNAFSDPVDEIQQGGVTGDLVAVEPAVDGGSIPVGTRSQVIVRFRNDSVQDITFRDINLYPGSSISAGIAIDQCGEEPLTPGAECALILSVKGLQAGPWRIEMLVRHSGRARLATATVEGTVESGDIADGGQAVTDIEVSPAPVDFGQLTASRPIIRSVTVRNITSSAITINDIYIDAPYQSGYELRTDCALLQSGQACIASIIWSPVIPGPTSGFLVVEHDGASRVANISLSGDFDPAGVEEADFFPEAVPGKGLLVSNQMEIDFGSGIAAQSTITLTLVNSGDTDVTLNTIQMAGTDNGLRIIEGGCAEGQVLTPTQACPLTLSWAPTKEGSILDDVQIYHTGARGVLVVPVRGSAVQAVNLDNRAMVLSGSDMSAPPPGPSGELPDFNPELAQQQAPVVAAPPSLDGYTVTSHSSNYAMINGPGGSRVVQDGRMAILAGHQWNVDIVPDGVELSSGQTRVMLVFDRSFNALVGGSGAGLSDD